MKPSTSQPVDRIAGPITQSRPFRRLYGITFLGILSPRYARLPGHPLSSRPSRTLAGAADPSHDQNRAHHSVRVAELVVRFCEAAGLPEETTTDGVMWALLHDIATWPLSHTSEAAFASITATSHKALRHKMVTGDPSVQGRHRLADRIRKCGSDPGRILLLFDKAREPKDEDTRRLHAFIHSAVTPDTLEGIHRLRRAFGVATSAPEDVLASLQVDLIETRVLRKRSRPVLRFMRESGTPTRSTSTGRTRSGSNRAGRMPSGSRSGRCRWANPSN